MTEEIYEYPECIDCIHKNTKVCNSCEHSNPTNFEEA